MCSHIIVTQRSEIVNDLQKIIKGQTNTTQDECVGQNGWSGDQEKGIGGAPKPSSHARSMKQHPSQEHNISQIFRRFSSLLLPPPSWSEDPPCSIIVFSLSTCRVTSVDSIGQYSPCGYDVGRRIAYSQGEGTLEAFI